MIRYWVKSGKYYMKPWKVYDRVCQCGVRGFDNRGDAWDYATKLNKEWNEKKKPVKENHE